MTAKGSYSYPPRGLNRETAARYVGVGTTKFDEMVHDGRMPRPIKIDGKVVWDIHKIDASFSDLEEKSGNRLDQLLNA